MEKLRVCNLYCGVGGNRKLWDNVEVTAVEYNEEIAELYSERFPQDNLVLGDAHDYLLKHYDEFDFIWSSPPCPTHSKIRMCNTLTEKKYPDMKLYQEIIFLKHFCKGKWIVENVDPYYEPLIPAKKLGRHLVWCNFRLTPFKDESIHRIADVIASDTVYGFSLKGRSLKHRKDKILRNQVNPELGLHILNAARDIITKPKTSQSHLFH